MNLIVRPGDNPSSAMWSKIKVHKKIYNKSQWVKLCVLNKPVLETFSSTIEKTKS